MLKAISLALLLGQTLFPVAPAGVASADAALRAGGNDKTVARAVGRKLFRTLWPAQVLEVYADSAEGNVVVGLRISGRRFHRALDRSGIAAEIASLAQETFSASAAVREVDAWLTLPPGKGAAPRDVNTPLWSTVMSISIRRGETPASVRARVIGGEGVFVDQEWARSALKGRPRVS